MKRGRRAKSVGTPGSASKRPKVIEHLLAGGAGLSPLTP
jgi:hypothetical protein